MGDKPGVGIVGDDVHKCAGAHIHRPVPVNVRTGAPKERTIDGLHRNEVLADLRRGQTVIGQTRAHHLEHIGARVRIVRENLDSSLLQTRCVRIKSDRERQGFTRLQDSRVAETQARRNTEHEELPGFIDSSNVIDSERRGSGIRDCCEVLGNDR